MQIESTKYATSNCLFPNLRFGSFIRSRRQYMRMTCEQAAELTGMRDDQWHAMESGWLPTDQENLVFAIAGTLEVSFRLIEMLAATE